MLVLYRNKKDSPVHAIAHPEAANLAELGQDIENRLDSFSRDEKLRAAGEAIAHLAEICFARAMGLLENWEKHWGDRPQRNSVLCPKFLD